MSKGDSKHVVFWGTYDTGKPRVRLLAQAAEYIGYEFTEIQTHIWDGVEDKSQIKGVNAKLKKIFKLLSAYPGLIFRYLKVPKHKHVVIPYLGLFDVFVLWPFARIRGVVIYWDMFISLYDTVVNDRKILSKYHPLAWLLYAIEWLACRIVDGVFMDTESHAAYVARLYHLPNERIQWIPVGVESSHFPRQNSANKFDSDKVKVLFYGQFIPLHGINCIVDAAKLDKSKHIQWMIIGKGQLSKQIDERIDAENINTIKRINWVPYKELIELIHQSDICLGIFGTSQKAQRVIPNKLYQIMAAGKPFVTANTTGIQSLGLADNISVSLSKPGDAASLLEAVNAVIFQLQHYPDEVFQAANDLPIIDAREVSKQMQRVLR